MILSVTNEEEPKVADLFMGRCGIDCEACKYRTQTGCPGCPATEGKPFWGECKLAMCCLAKGHAHCGECAEFPCATLNEYAYDREQGDNGKRILNLRAWNEMGYDAWRRARHEQS